MDRKTLLLGLFTVIIWASAFPGIRAGLLGGYSSGHLVLMRFLIASIIFLIYAMFMRRTFKLPKKAHLLPIIGLSLLGITIYHAGVTFGQQTINAGTTGMIVGSAPIFTTLIAYFFFREHMSRLAWAGLFIGFIGIVLISIGSNSGELTIASGIFYVLIATIATSFFFVFQRPLFSYYHPIELMAYFTWFGTIPFLIFLPGFFDTIASATTEANIAAVYVGVFPAGIAYATWALALSRGQTSHVANLLYIEPAFVILIAWVWLNEWPNNLVLLGGFIAISSVAFVQYVESRQRRRKKLPKIKEA